jgi:gluconokinase
LPKPCILAIDIGSSSVRAAIYDHAAQALRGLHVKREWSFSSTDDGGSEMYADAAFLAVRDVVDAILVKVSRRKIEVTDIAICCFWHSLMGVDSLGRPTTSVLGWADTRSGKYSAELKRKFNESEVHNRTGAHFHSSFWPAKLVWLRKEQPRIFATTAKWIGLADYVAIRLTGVCATSISMASATGIFDQRKCAWDTELLRYLKVKASQLPQIAVAGGSIPLTSKALKRWPQLKDALLFLSIGDGAADHLGSCGIGKGKASLMIGTSAAMRVAYKGDPPAKLPDGLWCYRIDDKRVIVGGALSDGGNLYKWCKRNFNIPANPEDEIRRRDPQRQLPAVLPFFHGERSTGYREDARGEIRDLKGSHDSIDILHAAMLAVAERLAEIYKRLRRVSPIREIVASGGALRESPLWREIVADALHRELHLTTSDESALKGAVLLALDQINTK